MTTEQNTEVWTKRNGEKIRVCDMDEDHVRAALNMVIRRSRRRQEIAALKARLEAEVLALDDWDDDRKWGS